MALRRKMLETLSEMAKQQNDRHSNRLQIIEPTQQELLSDYHLSQIPELKEKKTRKKAQDKALEEQAYLKYLLENPKLFEDIVMKKDKKKAEKARIKGDVVERPASRKKLDDAMDEYIQSDKEFVQLAKQYPEELAHIFADAIVEQEKALQTTRATRPKLASVDDGIDETGAEERDDAEEEEAEEEEAEEEEAGDVDYISRMLPDNPKAIADAKALKASYKLDASNDYSKNMDLLRKNEDFALPTRQAVALQLAMEVARERGVAPENLPKRTLKTVTTATVPAPGRQVTIKEALASSSTAPAPGSAGVASRISAHVGPRKKDVN